jgi:CHAD domain-containing protein
MADGKWIGDISATKPLAAAARHVLTVRLHVVRDYLPQVIRDTDKDLEHVHQMRVATRRADAALRIFRSVLSRKVYKAERERLRRARRAAGAARDWDVFGEELQSRLENAASKEVAGLEYLIGYALGQRDAAQPELERVAQAQAADCEENLTSLLDAVRLPDDCDRDAVLVGLARPQLTELIQNLAQATSADLTDYQKLHQVRIEGKRLRYAMEVFAGCFAESFRTELYPQVEDMQEILGRANDSHVAILRLTPLRERLRSHRPALWKRLQAGIDGLLRYHQRRLPLERRKFLTWWERWTNSGEPALRETIAEHG